jgi:hypothetical protein
MTTITTFVPAPVRVPRGAPAAAWLFGALLNAFQRVAEKRSIGAAQARRRAEARETRRYALRVQAQDPRFAADLLAAADRHEQGIC